MVWRLSFRLFFDLPSLADEMGANLAWQPVEGILQFYVKTYQVKSDLATIAASSEWTLETGSFSKLVSRSFPIA
jgi:hypothetical protein